MSLYQHKPHSHHTANVNHVHDAQLSFGQRIADGVASVVGRWPFILIQSGLLFAWILFNSLALVVWKWDPAPFILLNLMLSFQAAYTGPVVMMSQNRQASKDRLMAENDYHVDQKSEHELAEIAKHLEAQDLVIRVMAEQIAHMAAQLTRSEVPRD